MNTCARSRVPLAIAVSSVLCALACASAVAQTRTRTSAPAPAASPARQPGADYADSWPPIIKAKSFRQARVLCESWLTLENTTALVEAHKCLAMVDLETSRAAPSDPEAPVDPQAEPSYEGPGVQRALEHVNKAIALAPGDLSAHLGRLLLLARSGRIDDLVEAFASSLASYKGPNALEQWLQFPFRMFDEGNYPQALAMYKALLKHSPRSFKAAEGVGVVLSELQNKEEALPYLERAVELAPEDPLCLWNLALAYDSANRDEGAESLYRKAIKRQTHGPTKEFWFCSFASFLDTKRNDRDTACDLQQKHCAEDKRPACLLRVPSLEEPAPQSVPLSSEEPPQE